LNKNADGTSINDCNTTWKKLNGNLPTYNSTQGNKLTLKHLLVSDAGTYNVSIADKTGHLVSDASIDIKVVPFTGTASCVIAPNAMTESGSVIDGHPAQNTFYNITIDNFNGSVTADFFNSTYRLVINFSSGNFLTGKPMPGIYPINYSAGYSTSSSDESVSIDYFSYSDGTIAYYADGGQVYVTHENGNLYLTLCSVSFNSSPKYTKNISAKIPL
jgi:hypothetical protein